MPAMNFHPVFQPRGYGGRKSATERKRDSRRNNPALVEAYNAKRRAQRHAAREHAAAIKLLAQQKAGIALPAPTTPAIRQPLLLPAPPVRLCLPAPSELPLFILPLKRPEPVLVEAIRREEAQRRAA
jgi:hypothetical protein